MISAYSVVDGGTLQGNSAACKKLNWMEEDNEELDARTQALSVDHNIEFHGEKSCNMSKDATEKLQPAAISEGLDDNLQSKLNLEEKTNKLIEDQAIDTNTREIPYTLAMTMSKMVNTNFSEEGMEIQENKIIHHILDDSEKHSFEKVQPENPISDSNHSMPFNTPREDIEFEENLLSCTLCEQKFLNERYLTAHVLMRHEKWNLEHKGHNSSALKRCGQYQLPRVPFSCSHCDYICAQSTNLKKHERIHNGEKPYSCSQCDKKFSDRSALNIHKRNHAGYKPFCCSQCYYKGSTSAELKEHKRIHTGDKPFSCYQCDYKTSQSSNLRKHERIHTGDKPFSCSQCDKKFSDRSALNNHIKRIHTAGKPFNCTQCDYKGLTSADMKKHNRIHTGEKPFSCTQCNFKCSLKGNLKRHQKIHAD